ncbi:aminoglycoside phosphotransferase [Nocardioides guangzhouensis]|uniref:Aminoglycoside phosphotransferase n=1 Tax=Nocardioides guangzhouensis TaxID=2497878 RepID=A0A4Q4Z3Q3_9ACTN|nr:aminoglycoside phosphotransferase [Nocardioides guangzhouensis]RYP81988.1 aminoglycoside phosphotransferase [Nocardioides guangzhouensis]
MGTIEELVAGATGRRPVRGSDAKSGAEFELLTLDGRSCFLKVLDAESDWIMRVTGNTDHWEHKVWRAGIYHRFPRVIDHTIIAMAFDTTGGSTRIGILMDDVSGSLVPPGDGVVTVETHDAFLRHMAQLHATFWGWRDTVGLCPMANRIRFFCPEVIAIELAVDEVPGPIAAADAGWKRLAGIHPELSALLRGIHNDPAGLVDALAETPATFVTGDWKMGNLGRHPDGRTVLVDQAYPGEAPGLYDLLWYVALNRMRLPVSKASTIAAYRAGLEAAGVDTSDWFDRQLGLSIIAIMATFAWEKALGDAEELAWWSAQVARAQSWLP